MEQKMFVEAWEESCFFDSCNKFSADGFDELLENMMMNDNQGICHEQLSEWCDTYCGDLEEVGTVIQMDFMIQSLLTLQNGIFMH